MNELQGKRIGFGITGSHCTYDETIPEVEKLMQLGAEVIPIASFNAANVDTRFGTGATLLEKLTTTTGKEVIKTIPEAEVLGPTSPLDCMVIAPLTGNSLSKLANAITDTPVLMAAKATLRNQRPVVVAISTNDGLGLNGMNLMKLMNGKNIYFVPFGQDSPYKKPTSLIANMNYLSETISFALAKKQYQPVLLT